jgi:hypothetical protein
VYRVRHAEDSGRDRTSTYCAGSIKVKRPSSDTAFEHCSIPSRRSCSTLVNSLPSHRNRAPMGRSPNVLCDTFTPPGVGILGGRCRTLS